MNAFIGELADGRLYTNAEFYLGRLISKLRVYCVSLNTSRFVLFVAEAPTNL